MSFKTVIAVFSRCFQKQDRFGRYKIFGVQKPTDEEDMKKKKKEKKTLGYYSPFQHWRSKG